MEERLLHYLWQNQCFTSSSLTTSEKLSLQVLNAGLQNHNAGPDFEHAIIILDGLIWHGNVEVHVYSSDWKKHNHSINTAYNNVILHVVWDNDSPIVRENGTLLPTLELKGHINLKLIDRYQKLMEEKTFIPCENSCIRVPDVYKISACEQASVEKLIRKAKEINSLVTLYAGDWEASAFIWLASSLGLPVNKNAFETLTYTLPFSVLRKYSNNILQLEALLFGVSGLLPATPKDEYTKQLIQEFNHLSIKHNLHNSIMPDSAWKFLRMRPSSFPTKKIALLAAVVHNHQNFLTNFIEAKSVKELLTIYAIPISEYWQLHYHFSVKATKKIQPTGMQSFYIWMINGVIPLVYAYGHYTQNEELKEKAMQWILELPPEQNAIIKNWKKLNWPATNAFETQGLLELKKSYCQKKACTNCTVGNFILQRT
jgi:hypothetical protein